MYHVSCSVWHPKDAGYRVKTVLTSHHITSHHITSHHVATARCIMHSHEETPNVVSIVEPQRLPSKQIHKIKT